MCSPGVQGHGRPRRVVNSTSRESFSAAQIPVGILWGVTPKLLIPRAESVIKAKNCLSEGHVGCQKGRTSARATIHDRRGAMEGQTAGLYGPPSVGTKNLQRGRWLLI